MAGCRAYGGLGVWVAALGFVAGCGGRAGTTDNGAETTSTSTGTTTSTGTSTSTGTTTGTGTSVLTATGQSSGVRTWVDTAYNVCMSPESNLNQDSGAQLLEPSGALETTSFSDDFRVDEICQDLGEVPGACLAAAPDRGQALGLFNATRGSFWLRVVAPDLSADFFALGETLELTLQAWPYAGFTTSTCQSVQLSRAGATILFAYSCFGHTQSGSSPSSESGVPKTVTVGELTLGDAGVTCASTVAFCDYWYHSASVQLAGVHATVYPGQKNVTIGDYAFTLSSYRDAVDRGFCDGQSEVRFIAIARP